ncbi:MAG: hypothetical protein PUD72_04065 [Oscillospiraceae bacterium]|nr:hypothetical protein [Oscillospiraceae bacterium]
MIKNDLTGRKFEGKDSTEYVVVAGKEGDVIAYEETLNPNASLCFCCDAFVNNNRLCGTYFVSYTVSKVEFFKEIDMFSEDEKMCAENIALALRKKYYKIPTVFLTLVGEAYLRERF